MLFLSFIYFHVYVAKKEEEKKKKINQTKPAEPAGAKKHPPHHKHTNHFATHPLYNLSCPVIITHNRSIKEMSTRSTLEFNQPWVPSTKCQVQGPSTR